jgi:hypothetical protein
MKRVWLCGSLLLALAGCAGTMSGLDGPGKFSCKAPDGISCASLSGVYANALQNHLPGQAGSTDAARSERRRAIPRAVPSFGEPIRSAQKVRRVWLAPWEDDDEVLHDQSYLYLVVDPGRWQVEHARGRRARATVPSCRRKPLRRRCRNPASVRRCGWSGQSAHRPMARFHSSAVPGRDLLPPAGRAEP